MFSFIVDHLITINEKIMGMFVAGKLSDMGKHDGRTTTKEAHSLAEASTLTQGGVVEL